jgi:hypothetical protein
VAGEQVLQPLGVDAAAGQRGVDAAPAAPAVRLQAQVRQSWLSCWRQLQVRWDQDSERWFGFVLVACAVVCFNHLYRNDIVGAQTRR